MHLCLLSTQSTGEVQCISTNWRPLVISVVVCACEAALEAQLQYSVCITGTEASAALLLSFP